MWPFKKQQSLAELSYKHKLTALILKHLIEQPERWSITENSVNVKKFFCDSLQISVHVYTDPSWRTLICDRQDSFEPVKLSEEDGSEVLRTALQDFFEEFRENNAFCALQSLLARSGDKQLQDMTNTHEPAKSKIAA